MPAHRSPTMIGTETHSTAGVAQTPRATDSLLTAVGAGLACLRNLALVDAVIEVANVEDRLRIALEASHANARGRVAARIACAHLAAGDLTEAYFALLQARDHMFDTI